MAGFNYAQNIIGLDKVKGNIHELEVDVANLSASVLTIAGDVDELELSVADLSASVLAIGGEVDEIELSISQLSASTLPYSVEQSIKQKIDELDESIGEWSQAELLYSETWGDLYGTYNEKCKLAVLRWYGNTEIATAGAKEYTLPAHYKPSFFAFSTMHNSTLMEVIPQAEKVNIQFTANNWVAGSIIYPTV